MELFSPQVPLLHERIHHVFRYRRGGGAGSFYNQPAIDGRCCLRRAAAACGGALFSYPVELGNYPLLAFVLAFAIRSPSPSGRKVNRRDAERMVGFVASWGCRRRFCRQLCSPTRRPTRMVQ